MSDTQPAPDWWQASDLKWYPPQQHPDYRAYAPAPRPPTHFAPKVSDIAGISPAGPPEGYWQGTDGWWYPPRSGVRPTPRNPKRPPFKRLWFWLVIVALSAGGMIAFLVFDNGAVDDIAGPTHTIIYSATGTASVADIAYAPLHPSSGQVGMVRVANAPLPWTKTITTSGSLTVLSVSARTGAGNITCKITEDGKLLATDTVTGASGTADCSSPGT